jgi:hypothetical protein
MVSSWSHRELDRKSCILLNHDTTPPQDGLGDLMASMCYVLVASLSWITRESSFASRRGARCPRDRDATRSTTEASNRVARSVDVREVLSLDGEWQFVADPERLLGPDRLPPGQRIAVPGCWEAQVPRPQRILTAWYLRSVWIPSEWRGRRAVLMFGAVMYEATVYLNGNLVGSHEGGYTPFELDVADVVRWGAENDLVVRVQNSLNALRSFPARQADFAEADRLSPEYPASEIPHGKQSWYGSQSGIWQSVRMERRSDPSLGPLRVEPDVGSSSIGVRWSLDGPGRTRRELDPAMTVTIELTLVDPGGSAVGSASIRPNGDAAGQVRIDVPDPQLWDIGDPNLYRIEARLVRGDEAIDRVETRFGMREVRTEAGRILLNGRPIYLLGVLDQDLYADTVSTPPSRAMLDDQLVRAKELGINLLRCHIKVPDPAYLDAADEAGILLWCELPNWQRFSAAAARRGRETLQAMVETLGNHPSIIIWTIINEDWGTRIREESRDRLWLAETYAWLKALDPTRLVVDNSACDTAATPNFHIASDIADFHVYHSAPDNAPRWRHRIEEFAGRPAWLWSPHGDARPRGDEPLVLSEFGSWSLPRLDRVVGDDGQPPWWFDTGRDHLQPAGIVRRFSGLGLDRVWGSINDLAEATQWHQFEALQFEIGQLRRHDSIQGYVITELADAYWEANGLLDVYRRPKAFYDRFAAFNNRDVVVVDLDRRDVWAGESISAMVHLASYPLSHEAAVDRGGRIEWRIVAADGSTTSGDLQVDDWPRGGARCIGRLIAPAPNAAGDARIVVRALDGSGAIRAADEYRLAILPRTARFTDRPLPIAVDDPLGSWGVEDRLTALGHRVSRGETDLRVTTAVTPDFVAAIDAGAAGLVLARDRHALGRLAALSRAVDLRARADVDPDSADGRSPWDGDWVTAWSWLLPGALPDLPQRNPLDFAYAEVMPDHVLAGYEPTVHREEVAAGMFAGWLQAPAALIWTFPQGRGRLTVTTFRLAPERGPVATVMLEGLVRQALGSAAVSLSGAEGASVASAEPA